MITARHAITNSPLKFSVKFKDYSILNFLLICFDIIVFCRI